jgi:glyoxylase-like metal-dependent hydrolase (beta-lactamase superfamily II)
MRFGDIEVRLLGDGTFRLDGGAMFGVIPRTLWQKKSPPDEQNRILLAMNILLIQAAGKRILVETGAGQKWDTKRNAIYAFETEHRLPQRLALAGISPENVDIVVNTHLHFDHCGGNTKLVAGHAVPAFPNARYIVQRGEFIHAKDPTDRDRASYLPENFEPIEQSGQWHFLDGDAEIVPGVDAIVMPGHTRHMQCIRISGGGSTAFFLADLIPTTAHLSYPWIMGYDLYPLTTLDNKKKWLPRISREGWIALFAHDPHVPAAKLLEREGGFGFEPVPFD